MVRVGEVLSLILIPMILVGCAGVEADIEKAEYLVGKGTRESALKALEIVTTSKIEGQSGEKKLELIRIYAAAQMNAAGISPQQIVSTIVYSDDNSPIADTKAAFTGLASDAEDRFTSAATILDTVVPTDIDNITSADFRAAPERLQNDLLYVRGLLSFVNALRISINVTGLVANASVTTLTAEDCLELLEDSGEAVVFVTELETSEGYLMDGLGLNAGNQVIEFIHDIQDGIGDDDSDGQIDGVVGTLTETELRRICDYIINNQN